MSGEDFSQWYEIMKYIREAPGRVYADELAEKMHTLQEDEEEKEKKAVYYLNTNSPIDPRDGSCFLRRDPLTNGIFSIPSQRNKLDSELRAYFKDTQTPYHYNENLYSNSPENTAGWTIQDITRIAQDKGVVWFDSNGYLYIDLTRLPSNEICINKPHLQDATQFVRDRFDSNGCLHIKPEDFKRHRPRVDNFKLQELVDNFGGENIAGIGKFKADGVVFTGKTEFSFRSNYEDSPPLKRGLCLRNATFCGDVEVKNVTFDLSSEGQLDAGYNTSKVDFRNVRFLGKVLFRNVRFTGNSPDAELSFEDARIQHKSKDGVNEIEFNNVDFGNTHLNCFQMIVGEFVFGLSVDPSPSQSTPCDKRKNIIRFNNVLFGDGAKIDFTDAEIDNGLIEISNISALPLSYFCFAPKVALCYIEKKEKYISPCNYLSFSNCEIQKSLHIRNVSELSFKNTHNYGKIVAEDGWGEIAGCEKLKSAGVLGDTITNKLLQAVYQTCECEQISKVDLARSFVMLKENFAAMGLYDDEDDAFVLYMEFKPYLNKEKREKKQIAKKENREKRRAERKEKREKRRAERKEKREKKQGKEKEKRAKKKNDKTSTTSPATLCYFF